MLAVDFAIVDGSGAVEYLVGENGGRASGGEKLLAFLKFAEWYPVVTIHRPDRVDGGAFNGATSTEHFDAAELVHAASNETVARAVAVAAKSRIC